MMADTRKRRSSPYEPNRPARIARKYENSEHDSTEWSRRSKEDRKHLNQGDYSKKFIVPINSIRPPYKRVKIDRTKVTPMLIRMFCNVGKHNKIAEFTSSSVPANELKIYTWRDASLKELTQLILDVFPDFSRFGTCFDFSVVYPNIKGGVFSMKDIGSTCSGQKRNDDTVTLEATKFKAGDIIDVAIYHPRTVEVPVI